MNLEFFKKAVKQGGTYTKMLGEIVEVRFQRGYQVGTIDYYETDIVKAFEKFVKLIIEEEIWFVGVWEEDGKIYIEESIYIKDKIKAKEAGRDLNQLAIYNWEEDKVEWL